MPGTFKWNASNNTATVTGGTSVAPATFSDFHTADLAGTQPGGSGLVDGRVLLDAGVIDTDPDTFSLTTPPHPCEQKVIPLIISTSADRTGATLDLVGKDGDGDAISETAIDISGAHTAPVTTTLKFASIDASGVTVNGMINGDTITIKQERWGVIWDKGSGQYHIDCYWNIGDGSTSTYFKTLLDQIIFYQDRYFNLLPNATLQSGLPLTDNRVFGISGSNWSFYTSAVRPAPTLLGIMLSYGSKFIDRNYLHYANNMNWQFTNASSVFYDSVFEYFFNITFAHAEQMSQSCYFMGGYSCLDWLNTSVGCKYGGGKNCFQIQNQSKIIVNNPDNLGCWIGHFIRFYHSIGLPDKELFIINSLISGSDIEFTGDFGPNPNDQCFNQFLFNIHLTDINGINISGATVTLKDKDGNSIFSEITDVNGEITFIGEDGSGVNNTVTITRYFYSGGIQFDTRGPHALTITKDGYQDYQDVITIDRAMDLEVALLASVAAGGVPPVQPSLLPLGVMEVVA